jgi:hypothetical protein
LTSRFTVKLIAQTAVLEFFNLDQGFLYTLRTLTTTPGHAVRAYISGRTVRLTNPVKYMLVAYVVAGATIFGVIWGEIPPGATLFMRVFVGLPILVMVIFVPLSAAISRALFRRSGVTFAENLIYHTYTMAHLTIISTIFGAIILICGGLPLALVVVGEAVLFAYMVWAAIQFFQLSGPVGIAKSIGLVASINLGLAGVLYVLMRVMS